MNGSALNVQTNEKKHVSSVLRWQKSNRFNQDNIYFKKLHTSKISRNRLKLYQNLIIKTLHVQPKENTFQSDQIHQKNVTFFFTLPTEICLWYNMFLKIEHKFTTAFKCDLL